MLLHLGIVFARPIYPSEKFSNQLLFVKAFSLKPITGIFIWWLNA